MFLTLYFLHQDWQSVELFAPKINVQNLLSEASYNFDLLTLVTYIVKYMDSFVGEKSDIQTDIF